MKLQGKRAIVTGGAGAIGSAISLAFGKEGADVLICDLMNYNRGNEVAKQIQDLGRKGIALETDLRKPKDLQNAVRTAVKEFGGVDIVVNCATAGQQIPFLELTEEVIDDFFDTNLRGYFLTSLYAAKEIAKQGTPGWIVNVSSISSRSMTSSYVHYSATKGGIESLTRGMAVALGKYNIRVNSVAPGCVMTPTVRNMFDDPRNAEPVNSRTPLGRIVTIEEVVEPVVFLCTNAASGITGQIIDIDGGYSIQGMEWVLTEDIKLFREKLEGTGYKK
ncbi:MAG: hypothetical protein A2X25_07585 [Chloroflexi bacterium GWB2_49_20]|nr:MAG: hypothetical protein A2X25_07585 [Chloroflexi bacterium GWB2_49_20]OGN78016.1 MAG: hypothetical protein A2X26_15390 [Chloroflexi bacterium GWC2_49_37]OGN85054.1 MAG: hypothetical protein A2X27_10090 [Chloroflexi bacterium GWD2_49_16]HBG74910.1 dehydrogenase [Anaerolineae bacterium]HCC78366.1 dehydrogenase [Anaerolineae bacterium]